MKRATDPDVLLLQAAADPTRLSILRQLSAEGAVCNFTDCCGIGQPTVSHHLRCLRIAGWVTTERRGTWIYYSLRPEAVARFRELAGELEPRSARPAGTLAAAVPLAGSGDVTRLTVSGDVTPLAVGLAVPPDTVAN
jgi:DNA-binding transcriptional ArsR family regulator